LTLVELAQVCVTNSSTVERWERQGTGRTDPLHCEIMAVLRLGSTRAPKTFGIQLLRALARHGPLGALLLILERVLRKPVQGPSARRSASRATSRNAGQGRVRH
jgi:hypothetical protein